MSEFMDDFPKNTLLNKGKTGVGATSMALKHKDKFVIAVPFKDLASNKKEWCEKENIDVLIINGDTTNEEILKFRGDKIIAVYDSLYKVSKNLPNFDNFRILIDEAHILLLSGDFRKKAIYTVFEEYKKYKDFIFLTATIPSRMYEMEEFKNMNKSIIKWKLNPQPIFSSHIIDPYSDETLRDVLYAICIEHLNETRTSNAYIFINSVKAIKQIIKLLTTNNDTTFEDINIIAASSNESHIETDLGGDFSIGKPPKSVNKAKKLNFITSTGFEGQDFYDSNGKTYIVSDGNVDFMKLDLLTQVPQIVGRLRDSNLNDKIPLIIVPNEVDESQTEEMFKKSLKSKLTIAKRDIAERKRLLKITKKRFEGADGFYIEDFKNFLSEVKNKPEYYVNYQNSVSINKLSYLTNLNKWDVRQQGVLSVWNDKIGMNQAKYSEIFEMNFKYERVHNMPIEFIKDRKGESQPTVKLVTKSFELLDIWLSSDKGVKATDKKDINPEFYAFYIPDWIKEAYFTIGKERMKVLRYSKNNIEEAVKECSLNKSVPDILNLKTDKWYSNPDLKNRIKKAYDSLGITKTATASDIELYYKSNISQRRIDGVRKHGFLIESKKIM